MKIGLIAEDKSDIDILKEIALKVIPSRKVGYKGKVGKGCGKLKRKCQAYADNLIRQGCSWIVLVHDLDQCDVATLRGELEKAISTIDEKIRVVIIPVRTIESWLLYDPRAIALAFNESRTPSLPGMPESLSDPEKRLKDIIWKTFRKRYLNTVHNARIAHYINLTQLRKARSLLPYPRFLEIVKKGLALT